MIVYVSAFTVVQSENEKVEAEPLASALLASSTMTPLNRKASNEEPGLPGTTTYHGWRWDMDAWDRSRPNMIGQVAKYNTIS